MGCCLPQNFRNFLRSSVELLIIHSFPALRGPFELVSRVLMLIAGKLNFFAYRETTYS